MEWHKIITSPGEIRGRRHGSVLYVLARDSDVSLKFYLELSHRRIGEYKRFPEVIPASNVEREAIQEYLQNGSPRFNVRYDKEGLGILVIPAFVDHERGYARSNRQLYYQSSRN